ncbi:MAG TPA: polysaccharide deacetylase family protein [Gaiellaceae bacterium]|nr:polysaccharide deacetylase family protein [Gaiellaceae bacterium]
MLLLSIDFEDWHQLVHRRLGRSDWDRRGAALERQTDVVLTLLDDLGVKATFFVLGMTADRYPDVVREVAARGHEIASHGYAHERVHSQTPDSFRADVERSLEAVESAAGVRPVGYRAPAFSITRDTPWAYDVLGDLRFEYDSSQYDSPRVPNRISPIPRAPYRLRAESGAELWELPVAAASIPVSGGAYWRVLPAALLSRTLRRLIAEGAAPALYFHPYEFDPEPLRADGGGAAGTLLGVRRNVARGIVAARLRKIAADFPLLPYGTAVRDLAKRPGARPKTLSGAGLLV